MAIDREKIIEMRKNQGHTQRSLGEASGIPYSTINRIEKGVITQLRSGSLVRLAEALGVTPNDLLKVEGMQVHRKDHSDLEMFEEPGSGSSGTPYNSSAPPSKSQLIADKVRRLSPKDQNHLIRYIDNVLMPGEENEMKKEKPESVRKGTEEDKKPKK